MTNDDLKHFYIVADDGYPSLEYFHDPSSDQERGEHVCFAEAGISLHFLVSAAERFTASLTGGVA